MFGLGIIEMLVLAAIILVVLIFFGISKKPKG